MGILSFIVIVATEQSKHNIVPNKFIENLNIVSLLQLSSLLSDIGLNIREAHVFSTLDGYSLDVFVVDGWHTEVSHFCLSSL